MATDLYAGIATTLSIFACIWLFSAYSHTHPHHRSIPLQMILVLGIFDFIQSIASVLAFGSDILNEKGIHINSCFYTQTVFWFSVFFSLFWSCALAVFSAKAINAPQAISPRSKKLFYSGIFICMVFAALLIVP